MVSLPLRKWSGLSPLPASDRNYCRTEQLPGLIGLWPRELQDYSYPGTCRIAALLRKALRAERNRGRAGHWTYNLNRHLALIEALKHERARLKVLEKALPHRGSVCKPGSGPSRLAGTLRLPFAQPAVI